MISITPKFPDDIHSLRGRGSKKKQAYMGIMKRKPSNIDPSAQRRSGAKIPISNPLTANPT